jgi:hypothetical protein
MSQIKDEFGGTGSHALSEYRALAGLGVSGIPASGAISFSQFHGKGNQVTTSVWVSSGYNTTQETHVATYWTWWYAGNGNRWGSEGFQSWYGGKWIVGNSVLATSMAASIMSGGYKYVRGGSYFWAGNSAYTHHQIFKYSIATVWVDTSAYQNTTTTAQIST